MSRHKVNRMYIHLDESNMEQMEDGTHAPAIPYPYYEGKRVVCGCGALFESEAAYRMHYRTKQMQDLNTIVGEIVRAAMAIYDNRLDKTSAEPYAPKYFWQRLGMALNREDSIGPAPRSER